MIGIIFNYEGEFVEVRVVEDNVYFRNTWNTKFATVNQIHLSKNGCEREFPDLIGDENWREKAIQRFKDKIKSFKTEKERINYIIEDLKKFGYEPKYLQQDGFRVKKIK